MPKSKKSRGKNRSHPQSTKAKAQRTLEHRAKQPTAASKDRAILDNQSHLFNQMYSRYQYVLTDIKRIYIIAVPLLLLLVILRLFLK